MEIPRVTVEVHVRVQGDGTRVGFRDFAMEAEYIDVVYVANDDGVLEVVQAHITGRRVLVNSMGLGKRFFQRHTPWAEVDRSVRDRADALCIETVERVQAA